MKLNFDKSKDGLLPAIVQDATTQKVLMLGYMNAEAVAQTQQLGRVTFFSRSKNRLWTKGEESGHFLEVVAMQVDCDHDTLLIQARPLGPTCHKGTNTCWGDRNQAQFGFLSRLEATIQDRVAHPKAGSYINSLMEKGINKIAQKVGEEAVETVIEAKDQNSALFLNESADLLFHLLILLNAKGHRLEDVVQVLEARSA